MRAAFRSSVCAAFLLAFSLLAFAAELRVSPDGSADYKTIKAAMDAAAFGDVILVAGGVYEEPVTLRDGVAVIGAGPQRTIVRYTYAFDAVLIIDHVSSGRVEGMTIERAASILEGPAIQVIAGTAVLVGCVVSGGAGPGVDIADVASNLSLDSVTVEDNAGAGVWVHGGARVSLRGCTVRENGGPGVRAEGGTRVEATDTRFEGNGEGGVVLRSDAAAVLRECEAVGHSSGGIWASADAEITASDLVLTDNVPVAIRLTDRAVGTFDALRVEGGGDAVSCEDLAACTMQGCRLEAVGGDGLHAADGGSIVAETCAIVGSAGDGAVFESSAPCALTYSTVVRAGGDGVRVSGGDAQVEHCILAYNGGAGLKVDDLGGAVGVRTFSHNCVWGNGTDYEGTTRRPSDVAAAPEFADVASGDVSLRLDSPCVEAGVGWTTLGAFEDPSAVSFLTIDLLSSVARGWFGETWHADLRLSGLPLAVDALGVGFRYARGGVSLDVESTVLGGFARRVSAAGGAEHSWSQGDEETAALRYGFAGVLAGAES